MKLSIPRDYFSNPTPPRLFLCTTGGKRIGEIQAYDTSGIFKWASYSEAVFSVDRTYTDVLTGQTYVNPIYDKIEGPRLVEMDNIGRFIIQDNDTVYGERDNKTITIFSSEYTTASKYLENFYVNNGAVDSIEVTYESSKYGANAIKDDMYKLASATAYNPKEQYFYRAYSDARNYTYEQIQIADENEYAKHFGSGVEAKDILYVHGYANVQFYDPFTPELSLLHNIFKKIPDWKIGHVDYSLWHKERKFEEDRIAVYDFLMNEVQDKFKCVVEWDTLENTVNFYEEAEDGITEDNTVQTRFNTDVYITKENLANEINVKWSTDDIKTKLKVSGEDELSIREVNLGKNYIMNLDYYRNFNWMEPDLLEAYDDYLKAVELYTPQYTKAMQNWVDAYNKWNDLMNAVPAEGNVVLVGDPFKKLYCTYTPINTAYSPTTITNTTLTVDILYFDYNESTGQYSNEIDKSTLSNGEQFVVQGYAFEYDSTNNNFKYIRDVTEVNLNGKDGLIDRLTLYHINEDINYSKTDNILLRLKNKNSDIATIRIYNAKQSGTDAEKKENPDYKIQVVITYAQSGITHTLAYDELYSMEQWIKGELTAEYMGLKDYTVQYIGTMGAYFVLAKDETEEATLEEYGVNLLKEKHEIYTTIFQTQTEAMFSQEKYQCVAQSTQPEGSFNVGTRWLDTDSSPVKLYQYSEITENNITKKAWQEISGNVSEGDQTNYENYQRYIDNYEKLIAVQNVLVEKERQAAYMRDGYRIADRNININLYTKGNDGVLRYNGQTLEGDMHRVAETHFSGHTVTRQSINQDLPVYYFTTSYDPDNIFAVYLKGTTPYVAYAISQGVYSATMDWITQQTDFENFFTEDQWVRLSPLIREDEFSDSNFLLTSYESEEERLRIYRELLEEAAKELKTLSQPSLEFSMEMANILALPAFEPIWEQFALGNFIRIELGVGLIKRARLLEVQLNFSDLSDFSATFGNLVTTKSEVDKHADLLKQAVTAGKQVASSAGDWQKAVDKSNKLEEEIANGLQNAALEVGRASGQSIVWDSSGIWGRKLVDGTTDQYEDEQFRIINNKLVFSNDGFKTSKSVMGRFVVKDDNGNDVTRWGLLAEAMVGGYIEGSEIRGGTLRIGDGSKNYFEVAEDGNVRIVEAGQEKYASTDAIKEIDNAYRFQIILSYNKSTVFSNTEQDCTITCTVYDYSEDITSKVIAAGGSFSWARVSSDSTADTNWNSTHIQTGTNANKVTLKVDDIFKNSQFSCSVDFDETKITT